MRHSGYPSPVSLKIHSHTNLLKVFADTLTDRIANFKLLMASCIVEFVIVCEMMHILQPPRVGGVKVYIDNIRRNEVIMDMEIV